MVQISLSFLFTVSANAENVEKWLIEGAHSICPGSTINSCRNPSCPPDSSQAIDCDQLVGAQFGGTYHTTESCTNKFDAKAIALTELAKKGVTISAEEAATAIKDFSSLQCNVIKDPDPQVPSADLCGNNEPEVNCHYLGNDECFLDVITYSSCQNFEYCGISAASCHTILNGLDLTTIPPHAKQSKIEVVALSIMEIALLGSQSDKLSEGDAHAFVVKTVQAAKEEDYDSLVEVQAEIRKLVFAQ